MTFIRRHRLFMAGIILGCVLVAIAAFGTREVIRLRTRVIRVEANTPCLNLTAAECALKLFRALPEQTRRELRVSNQTLRSLQRRATRERQNLRRTGASPRSQSKPHAGGDSPGRSPGGSSPSPGGQRPGSSPGPSPMITPTPAPTPSPVVRTPGITTPPLGPVPPITINPIEVPCPSMVPVIKCQ